MSLVRWTTEYEIGQERIDREHRDLFDCINRFHDAWCERQDRREILRLLSLLIEYAERHFRNEEQIMREAEYPSVDEHAGKHERLVETVFDLARRLEDRAFNPSHDTIMFLRSWLTEHILREDMLLKAFLAARQASAADAG